MYNLNHGMAYFVFHFSVVGRVSGHAVQNLEDSPLHLRTSQYKGNLRYFIQNALPLIFETYMSVASQCPRSQVDP